MRKDSDITQETETQTFMYDAGIGVEDVLWI